MQRNFQHSVPVPAQMRHHYIQNRPQQSGPSPAQKQQLEARREHQAANTTASTIAAIPFPHGGQPNRTPSAVPQQPNNAPQSSTSQPRQQLTQAYADAMYKKYFVLLLKESNITNHEFVRAVIWDFVHVERLSLDDSFRLLEIINDRNKEKHMAKLAQHSQVTLMRWRLTADMKSRIAQELLDTEIDDNAGIAGVLTREVKQYPTGK